MLSEVTDCLSTRNFKRSIPLLSYKQAGEYVTLVQSKENKLPVKFRNTTNFDL